MRTALSPTRRRTEALGLLATHGVADGATTALAASTIGAGAEVNPLLGALLAEGIGVAVAVMLVVVGAVAVAWPSLANWAKFSGWFAPALMLLGALVAAGNIAVVILA